MHAVWQSPLEAFVGEECLNRRAKRDEELWNHANEMKVDMFKAQKAPISPHLV